MKTLYLKCKIQEWVDSLLCVLVGKINIRPNEILAETPRQKKRRDSLFKEHARPSGRRVEIRK